MKPNTSNNDEHELDKITVQEIKFKLHKFQNKDLRFKGRIETNKLVKQYRRKVQYMLMWMRLIPIDKRTLAGWGMPDMNTISKFKKENK